MSCLVCLCNPTFVCGNVLDIEATIARVLRLADRPVFWLVLLVAPVCALLPDIVISYIQRNYFPQPWDITSSVEPTAERGHDVSTSSENDDNRQVSTRRYSHPVVDEL